MLEEITLSRNQALIIGLIIIFAGFILCLILMRGVP